MAIQSDGYLIVMMTEEQDEEMNGIVSDLEMYLAKYDPVTKEPLSGKELSRLGYDALERLKCLWENISAYRT